MARIRPFRGLRYDATAVAEFADVLAPPYDVVDDAGRARLAARSPLGAIHFILPTGEGDEKYAVGAREFRRIVGEAMVRDEVPAYYVYHQRFNALGQTFVRKGFIGLIELTRFGAGPVLAHERTLAGPKRDRLALMRATSAHLELVFGLFSDPGRGWEATVEATVGSGKPVLKAAFDDVDHTLWRVEDPDQTAALSRWLAERKIYIADGHHRYETMCTWADELRAAGHPAPDFGMIYLSNLDDPGLVVLPTHRRVHGLPAFGPQDLAGLLARVGDVFAVETVDLPADATALRTALAPRGTATFGLTVPGSGRLHVLRRRPEVDAAAAGLSHLPEALWPLDVVLLHEVVLERGLGIGKQAQEDKRNLGYDKSTERALEQARTPDGDTQLWCLMNATPVEAVKAVCDSGHVMPQKSTFFHPKIPGGLVFYDLDPTVHR